MKIKVIILLIILLTVPLSSLNAIDTNNNRDYSEEELKQAGGLDNLLENEKKIYKKV